MASRIKRVDYFYITVSDQPGEAFALLAQLAEQGVDLLAFTAVPMGPMRTQLSLFPADNGKMESAAKQAGLATDGPHPALLVQGDDELGALAGIHAKLSEAGVNVFSSNGVSDGKGSYGYVIYVRPERIEEALSTLGV